MEILRRAVEVGRSVRSVRISSTHISEEGGERSETVEEEIRIGGDRYTRRADEAYLRESLEYGGRPYFRLPPAAEWKPAGDLGWSERESTKEADPSLWSELYGYDVGMFSSVERVGEEVLGDRRLIRVCGSLHAVVPPERRAKFSNHMRERLPDSVSMTTDVWVDAETYYIHRIETEKKLYRSGRQIASSRNTVELSAFNEPLELPGPLPQT